MIFLLWSTPKMEMKKIIILAKKWFLGWCTLSENYTSGTCSNTTNIYTYLGTQIKMKTIQFYNDCEEHEVDLSISNTYFISSLFDADWICLYFYSLCKNDYEIWEIFSWMKQNLLESKYRCITKSSKGIEFFHIASIFFQHRLNSTL